MATESDTDTDVLASAFSRVQPTCTSIPAPTSFLAGSLRSRRRKRPTRQGWPRSSSRVTRQTRQHARTAREATGFTVFGGVALNYSVGGINPHAVVETARQGGKVVWMPTIGARHFIANSTNATQLRAAIPKNVRGLTATTNGQLKRPVHMILDTVAEHDMVLASGHLAPHETIILFTEAVNRGIRRLIVNHPLAPFVAMGDDDMKTLADLGAYIEFTPQLSIPERARAIRMLGIEQCFIATDGGNVKRPPPVESFLEFIVGLYNEGFTEAELRHLSVTVPAEVLGLHEATEATANASAREFRLNDGATRRVEHHPQRHTYKGGAVTVRVTSSRTARSPRSKFPAITLAISVAIAACGGDDDAGSPTTDGGTAETAAPATDGGTDETAAPTTDGGTDETTAPTTDGGTDETTAPTTDSGAWDEVVAAAREEGKLVLGTGSGPGFELFAEAAKDAMSEYFDVEYTLIRGGDWVARVLAEQGAGQYLWDVHVGPGNNKYTVLAPAGGLDSTRDFMESLPEDNRQDADWRGGFDFFDDAEGGSFVHMVGITRTVGINRDFEGAGPNPGTGGPSRSAVVRSDRNVRTHGRQRGRPRADLVRGP